MRIGIVSDTHDNQSNLKHALEALRPKGIEALVHCGDMTNPETALLLVEYRIIYVYGNVDAASGEIRRTLQYYDAQNFSGPIFSGTLGGSKVAVLHGHQPGLVDDLAQSGKFRFILHGHTHLRRCDQVGDTWVINPGALGGANRQSRSCCTLDLTTGAVEFMEIH